MRVEYLTSIWGFCPSVIDKSSNKRDSNNLCLVLTAIQNPYVSSCLCRGKDPKRRKIRQINKALVTKGEHLLV